ncbi:MAG: 50S ribosomal protein L29 [Candidatus Yanofskybacteria bacterium GW2011_GWA1_39_13]|uniref:Large ribosomal subunit protein uL29 n=1 Tax=Yanofskybacteria sp. (strain GW2011_GWA1_39_13) TaxID=1619019 RepID=A0A0G0QKZ6_YANXG|nr:MAG: 50S ribosomal protein L29 [Candidatus Yanofskybacteria bacterium GW2011_GWA1_39_13]
MKNIDLQNKTKEEISTMLNDFKSKLLQLNFELGEKRLKDFSQVKKTKKGIARILTMLKQNGNTK